MALPELRIYGHGMEVTDAMKKYIREKLKKYERVFDVATSVEVEFAENVAARGVKEDFRVEIMMNLPRTIARVEKMGSDTYALVDEATDVLYRKVKRYKEKTRQWEGSSPWKVEKGEVGDVSEDFDFVTYVPKIVKRKKMDSLAPISEEEAIERMEMLGYDSYIFKNKKSDTFAMVYRRKRGGYGIVEPPKE